MRPPLPPIGFGLGGGGDEEERQREVGEQGGLVKGDVNLIGDVMGMARMARLLRISQ
jgi:hypothetical protein